MVISLYSLAYDVMKAWPPQFYYPIFTHNIFNGCDPNTVCEDLRHGFSRGELGEKSPEVEAVVTVG